MDPRLDTVDERIITGSNDHTLRIWNIQNKICDATFDNIQYPIISIAELSDGHIIFSDSRFKLYMWTISSQKNMHSTKYDRIFFKRLSFIDIDSHYYYKNPIVVLPNGYIVSVASDTLIKIWDPQTTKCVLTLKGHSECVTCITILPDGRIVSGSLYHTIKIWNPQTGKCDITLKGHNEIVDCIHIISGNYNKSYGQNNFYGNIISAGMDGTIRLWS